VSGFRPSTEEQVAVSVFRTKKGAGFFSGDRIKEANRRTLVFAGLLALQPIADGQVPPTQSTTVTATIAIDKATRVITLKAAGGQIVDVAAPEQMQGFNKPEGRRSGHGDVLRSGCGERSKPGAPPTPSTPVTTTRWEDRKPGSETRKQQTFTVTVESVDPKAPALTVKGPKGRPRAQRGAPGVGSATL
jgi:hypothetical protein